MRRHRGTLAIRSQHIISKGVIKVSLSAKLLKTIAKWFDLPPFYRNQKRSEHVFRLCSIFNSRNRKATGSRKHHYDDSEIKNFDFRAQLSRKWKKCACARARAFERDRIPLRSLIQGTRAKGT